MTSSVTDPPQPVLVLDGRLDVLPGDDIVVAGPGDLLGLQDRFDTHFTGSAAWAALAPPGNRPTPPREREQE